MNIVIINSEAFHYCILTHSVGGNALRTIVTFVVTK